MRRQAAFRRLVERFQDACRAAGVELSAGAAEDFLADRVTTMARILGISQDTVVRSHLDTIDVAALAMAFRLADQQRRAEVAEASHAVLDITSVGRLIAALGQATRCVSLNHAQLTRDEHSKWEAIGVLDDAGDAATLLGAALEYGRTSVGESITILVSDEAVVRIRRCLTQTVTNLRAGRWSFGHAPTLDADVAKRMAADLALLPPG